MASPEARAWSIIPRRVWSGQDSAARPPPGAPSRLRAKEPPTSPRGGGKRHSCHYRIPLGAVMPTPWDARVYVSIHEFFSYGKVMDSLRFTSRDDAWRMHA